MSRFIKRQNTLHKAQARFEKVNKRSNQFKIQFERSKNSKSKFKTKVNIVRFKKQYSGRGLIHKAVSQRYRFTGDKPSVTRYIGSFEPKTLKGRAFKKSAQAVNFAVHDTAKTAVDMILAAETVGIKSGDTVQREVRNKLIQKYTRESVDDYHRGTFAQLRIGADIFKGTRQHFKQKKQYKFEKAKFKLKKAEYAVFKHDTFKPKIKTKKTDFRIANSKFKELKQAYQSGSKSNIQKALKIRRTQKFQQTKSESNFERKKLTVEKKFKSKELKNQHKIAKNSKTGLLALKPASYTADRMKASAWQKAVNEDSDNDMVHVMDSAKRRIIEPAVQKVSKPQRLQRERKKRESNADKEKKSNKKLNRQENRLKEKHSKSPKKRKKPKQSFSEKFKNIAKTLKNFIKNVYEKEVKKFFACIAVSIIIILLVFAFIIMIFSSILSGGGFTLGTYAAQDYDLSQAEEYYTKLAWDMNEKILKVSDQDNWKDGLVSFGAVKKNLKDKPDNWYWGRSDVYNWNPVYDFDVYKMWAFLCAYYYDFSTENGDIRYWKFENDTEDLLDEIFCAEYEFVYWYDNTSRWEELSDYVYFGGGSAETGTYYRCETAAYIYEGQPYRYRFKPTAYTAELSQYFDNEGYICIDSNYRVLNPNDDYELTGYMIMDHRYFSGIKEPFYYIDESTNTFFFMHNGERCDRSFWGWNGIDAWFLVSPTDTTIWNYNITDACMYGCYQKYEWKTDCRLYYNVRQKKTFDEVINDKLSSMSHADERVQYYNLLIGTDSGTMYGNHQTLQSLTGTSIHDSTITNGFGWDMQQWNTRHCSLDDLHEAVDIRVTSDSNAYAPFDCEIDSYDDTKTVVLRKDNVQYWYDGNGGTKRDTEITIKNVMLKGYEKGDTISEGDVFAVTTSNYIHIKVEIDTDGYGWDFIDPRLVLY